jgi:hypothetical protein
MVLKNAANERLEIPFLYKVNATKKRGIVSVDRNTNKASKRNSAPCWSNKSLIRTNEIVLCVILAILLNTSPITFPTKLHSLLLRLNFVFQIADFLVKLLDLFINSGQVIL